jgi:hypothetical protein
MDETLPQLIKYAKKWLDKNPNNQRANKIFELLEEEKRLTDPMGITVERKLSTYSPESTVMYSFSEMDKRAKKGDIVIYAIGRYKIMNQDDLVQYMRNEFIRCEDGGDPIDHYHIITEEDLRNFVITCRNVTTEDIATIRNHLIVYFGKHNVTENKITIMPTEESMYNLVVKSMVGTQKTIFTSACEFRQSLEDKYEYLMGKITPFKSKTDIQTDKKYWEWLITRSKLSDDLKHREMTSVSQPIYITQNITINGGENTINGYVAAKTTKNSTNKWIEENPPTRKDSPTAYYEKYSDSFENPVSTTIFRKKMTKLGYVTTRGNKNRYWAKKLDD